MFKKREKLFRIKTKSKKNCQNKKCFVKARFQNERELKHSLFVSSTSYFFPFLSAKRRKKSIRETKKKWIILGSFMQMGFFIFIKCFLISFYCFYFKVLICFYFFSDFMKLKIGFIIVFALIFCAVWSHSNIDNFF